MHFAYATVAGTGTFAAPSDANWVTWGTPQAGHWYVVMAKCDMDGAGGEQTELVGSSYPITIFSRNEGM